MADKSSLLLELELLRARSNDVNPLKQVVPEKNKTKYYRDLIRTAAQGLSFGTADEIEAFVRSKVGDRNYSENLEIIRGQVSKFAEENPKLALGAEIAGSLPTALAGGAGLARLGVKGAAKIAGLEGAAYGFGAGEGGFGERAKSAAVGGVVGAGTGKLADAIFPKVGDAARKLMREGVRLTPGQRVGGLTKELEERATSLPFIGDVIEAGQQNAMDDFNRAAMNVALKELPDDTLQDQALLVALQSDGTLSRINSTIRMLGKRSKKVPKGKVGQEAYEFAKDQVDEAYAKVIPKLRANVGSDFEDGLVKIIQENAADLGEDGLKKFQAKLSKILASKVTSEDKILRGDILKTVDSDLGFEATKFLKSSVASERDLGAALSSVQTLLRDSMEGTSPQANREYKKVQSAFRTLLPVRKAVVAASTKRGTFTPAQLLRGSKAVDQSRDKIATATGKAPQQSLATDAQEVIGRTIPDSGTAERVMTGLLLNRLRTNPLSTIGGGGAALGATSLAYGNPLGRTLTSGLLQTPRAVGTLGAPALGAATATAEPTLEQLRLLEERFR